MRSRPLALVSLVLLAFSCVRNPPAQEAAPAAPPAAKEEPPPEAAEKPKNEAPRIAVAPATEAELANANGLVLRLKESAESATDDGADRAKLAPAEPLEPARVDKLLARLPALQKAHETSFALRESSAPPPKTGETIKEPFPPPDAPDAKRPEDDPKIPLEVVRVRPEGAVPIAPDLSVTFSEPMIAVTSQSEAAEIRPVQLDPEVPGKWRWVGTKTILFVPEPRFPTATEYRATVAKGTRSASGKQLAADKTWTFVTPPPVVQTFYPQFGPVKLNPFLFAVFDQKIDPAAVLSTISVTAAGKKVAVRLATPEELKSDPDAPYTANTEPGRWIAFRPANPLPPDAEIKVAIGPGTPSSEGPRKTEKAQNFSFKTFGPFKVSGSRCGWDQTCPPYQPFDIWFSNAIDASKFEESMVKVSPELPNVHVTAGGVNLDIRGSTKGRTKYTVTISPELTDIFGQKLGKKETVTFSVGSAAPSLQGLGELSVVLDPLASPSYSIYTMNFPRLTFRAYQVTPEQYLDYLNVAPYQDKTLPGKKIHDAAVKISGESDTLVETKLDLKPFLPGGLGHVVIEIRPPAELLTTQWMRENPPVIRRWIQATKIGLDAYADGDSLQVFTSRLENGEPLKDVELEIRPHKFSGKTDARGLADFPLAPSAPNGAGLIIAKSGTDRALLSETTWEYHGRSSWEKRTKPAELRYYIFDDRGLYRPGEAVHVKGFIRAIDFGKGGDVKSADKSITGIDYTFRDSRSNEITKGSAKLTALGGFDFAFTLPPTVNLGSSPLTIEARGLPPKRNDGRTTHWINIQEFRRAEFEVAASVSEGPHLIGQSAIATVKASYYAGGGLPGAQVNWTISAQRSSFTPPNRGDFDFGAWTPWWGHIFRGEHEDPRGGAVQSFTGLTDAGGEHHLAIELAGVKPPRAMTINAQATVTDVNRQAASASTSLLVHPSALYVGLRAKQPFVRAGESMKLEAIVVDLDGNAIAGKVIELRAARLEWRQKKGVWAEEELDEQSCSLTSAKDAVGCELSPKAGGRHKLRAQVSDDRGRPNETEMFVYVAGEKAPPDRGVEEEKVELIPNKKEYKANDTAELLIRAPFAPAHGILTVRRSGIISREPIELTEASGIVRVPIREEYAPNVIIQVDLSGAAARTDDEGNIVAALPKRPAYASGTLDLSVPPLARELAVTAEPKDPRLAPGAKTTVNVSVLDAAKKPVAGAEVVVVIADESVLAMANHRIPSPIEYFYPRRYADTRDYHSRQNVLLAKALDLAAMNGAPGGVEGGVLGGAVDERRSRVALKRSAIRLSELSIEGDSGGEGGAPIALRSDFNPLALFAAQLATDAAGKVSVEVKLPDNLTRYRITAVAVAAEKYFGLGESSLTARKPLMVRPSAPRFLNFGDQFELPVVIQNQTDKPAEVEVAVRASNAEFTAGQGRKVKVPADDRVEVRFPARAAKPGTARFQFAGASGTDADAAEVVLPVWTPATTEAFATYGELDANAIFQPVAMPKDAITEFGSLDVSVASTQLQALTDAVVSLVQYPFECSEQISSRVIAIAALKDVLNAFEAEGLPPPKQLLEAVDRDLERLRGMQNGDGGFAFWRRGQESWPFNSIHAAHAMARAKEKRFKVPEEMLRGAHEYLRSIENRYPPSYPTDVRRVLTAYALYVRNLLDDRDPARARKLIAEFGGVAKTPIEALGWLYPVLTSTGDAANDADLEAMRKYFDNRATETAGTAHFATSYSDGAHLLLHSDRRADALILNGLIGDRPKSDLIPKIVRGLLAHRTKGAWSSTQENVWVLLALDRYFATFEKTTPNFAARVWLGKKFAGEHRFRGRTTETEQIEIPIRFLAELSEPKPVLAIDKDGPGRLYYRIGLRYAPKSLQLASADHGFMVERNYEPIGDPAEVRRDADGTWHIRAGAKVRVRVVMVAPSRRYHVALVDPLPAGLEALNPALATTEHVPIDPKVPAWFYGYWYDHQNLRDERVEALTTLLWEGVHEYVYVARATTPGDFVVPPAKAEEMYAPETFGRSASARVVIE